jgi:signal transduction histidine kinase
LKAMQDTAVNMVRVSIRDSGIGIDQEEQKLVFDEFYRSNNPESRKHSGSGLGLAIVKQLVESQNGRVEVTSEGIGKGSEFSFTIPVALPSDHPRS